MRIISNIILLCIVTAQAGCSADYRSISTIRNDHELAVPAYVINGKKLGRYVDSKFQLIGLDGKIQDNYALPAGARLDWSQKLVTSANGKYLAYRLIKNPNVNSYGQPMALMEMDIASNTSVSLIAQTFQDPVRDILYSPEGDRLAILTKSRTGGYTLSCLQKKKKTLTELSKDVGAFAKLSAWDPSGKWIFLVSLIEDRVRVTKVNVENGALSKSKPIQDVSMPGRVAVYPASNKLIYAINDQVVCSDMDGNDSKMLCDTLGSIADTLAESRSGQYLAIGYENKDEGSSILFVETKTGNKRKIHVPFLDGSRYPRVQFLAWHPKSDTAILRVIGETEAEIREYKMHSLF